MGPICTHRAIAKHAVIVWLDRKTIMAAETSMIVQESKKQTCIMVEEDVPGAALKLVGKRVLWCIGKPMFSNAHKFCIRFC